MSDAERAEELASAIILLTLDETLYRLRKALAPRLRALEFAVGDDVAIYTGEHATASVIAYSRANAFRHAKRWEALLGSDHKFDPILLDKRRNEQAKKTYEFWKLFTRVRTQ